MEVSQRFTVILALAGLLQIGPASALDDSSTIKEHSLSESQLLNIGHLIDPKADPKVQDENFKALCPRLQVPAPPPNTLAKVDSDVWTEIFFERNANEKKGTTQQSFSQQHFSLGVKFSDKEILLKHGNPRYTADAGGLRIPFPTLDPREVYLEGKGGSDLLLIVPGIRGCSVHALVVCPRTFVPRSNLSLTHYTPNRQRVEFAATADGVLATHAEQQGMVRASFSGTEGLKLPDPRVEEARSTSATAALSHPSESPEADVVLNDMAITNLPVAVAVESKVEFDLPERGPFFFTHRSALHLMNYDIQERRVVVQGTELTAAAGRCYLVARTRSAAHSPVPTPPK